MIHSDCVWATNIVHHQTTALMHKFESGEVGEVAGDETKQQTAILRCVFEYMTKDHGEFPESYGVNRDMHRDKVFSISYLSRRVYSMPTFKDDRLGPTAALHRAMKALLDGGELVELAGEQKRERYRTTAKCYAVADGRRFIAAGRMKYGRGI